MVSDQARSDLHGVTWGRRARQPGDTNDSLLGKTYEELGGMQFWDAVSILDYLLLPFKSATEHVSSAGPSSASQKIEEGKKLTGVGRDDGWVEAVVAKAKLENPVALMRDAPEWGLFIGPIATSGRFKFTAVGNLEKSEAEVDNRTSKEIEFTDIAYCALRGRSQDVADAGRAIIYVLQSTSEISGGGKVRPDVRMVWLNKLIPIVRFENKTALASFALAHHLDAVVGKAFQRTWRVDVAGVYQQAYAPSQPNDSSIVCKIVRMGNPALYRWAYVHGTELYVSSWRSIDPGAAVNFLRTHYSFTQPIVQGHPILENLAMSLLNEKPMAFESWLKTRCDMNLRTRPQNVTLVRMMTMGADVWQITSDIFMRGKFPQTLTLGSTKVTGITTTDDDALKKRLKSAKPWPLSLKRGLVWEDGEWVVKVASEDERKAMLAVRGSHGVVRLMGSLEVTVGRYKGMIILFTRHNGTPVGTISADVAASTTVRLALEDIHQRGWHHHDVHPGNVLRDESGSYHLIDFGLAQPASECSSGADCADAFYLQLPSRGTSPSVLHGSDMVSTSQDSE